MSPPAFVWVRLLCLVLHLSADNRSPDTDRKCLKSPFPFLYLMVSIRVFQRTVCHEQRVLSLNPQIAFSFQADDLFGASRNIESYCASMVTVRPGRLSTWGTQFAKMKSFFKYRLRHPYNLTAFDFVHTAEHSRSTLAHSSNYRSVTDCVRFLLPNRKSKASLGFAVGSRCHAAFSSLRHNYCSPPNSIFVLSQEGTTLLAGAGDICLPHQSARRLT